jgi:DNA-binding SARP family transcriptional activator/CheY-like chemotaxis protein
MKPVRVTLLGGFRLEVHGEVRTLPTRKAEALLAYLAVRADRPHRRDALAALLWGDVSSSQARHSLRQALLRIRRVFADVTHPVPVLVTDGELVRINRAPVEVDVSTFQSLAAALAPEDRARAALLFSGELLEGFHLNEPRFDNWLGSERTRLHQIAIQVMTEQLQTAMAADEIDRAITLATALLALDATQEPVHRALMRLYRRQGRPGDALQQYNQCARILQQELGVEPDRATRQLCQDILVERARGLVPDRLAPAPPAVPSDTERPSVPTVLVLESNPVTRAMLERTLRTAGYAVVLHASAASLPSSPRVTAYAAVISGVMSSSGRVQLLSRLNAQGYQGFVLFIAAHAPIPLTQATGRIRVGYVRKPVHQRALLDTLRGALNTSSAA